MDTLFDGEDIYEPPDPTKNYYCRGNGFTLLMKWVLLTNIYPVLIGITVI
jgi:hypothetical protein